MKKIIAIITILFAAHTLTVAAETVKIGIEPAYPPFSETKPDGTFAGFDIDITHALCEQLKVECQLIKHEWDGLIPSLQAKKIDAIIASMSITAERKKKISFTNKYYVSHSRFVARKGSKFTAANFDLAGKTVAVLRSSAMDNFVTDNFGAYDILTVKRYASQEDAYLDMISGRVDLGFLEFGVAEVFLKSDDGKNFEMIGPSYAQVKWFGKGIGIAVRKQDNDLRKRLNAAIDAIRASGEYDAIRGKYFSYDIFGE